MAEFAANLSMLFTEVPLPERFKAAADAGFSRVEIQFPYELTAAQIQAQLARCHQQLILINAPAGDWASGERGIACHPDRIDEFRQGLVQAIEYALQLECRKINILAGITPVKYSTEQVRKTFIDNLRWAADQCQPAGIQLLMEAINTQDIPGFFLHGSQQAFELLDAVARDNLKLQYDIYHMQIMEGNIIQTLRDYQDRIGHIQFADVPGRHEPQTGELNFPKIFQAIDDMGYSGALSLEYVSATTTLEGLRWMSDTGQSER